MDRAELQRHYEEAGSLRQLAKNLGITHAGASYRLKKAGIPVRNSRPRTTPAVEPTAAEREEWGRLYSQAGSVAALARQIGKDPGTVRYHLRQCGITIDRTGFASPKTVPIPRGAAHFNWKGGTYRTDEGYVAQYAPEHPGSWKGYVLQHRLVMEAQLGRHLTSDELVHHENEIKDDNRPENLTLTNRSDHMAGHKEAAPRDQRGRFSRY